jgi:hypothetical protein
LLILTLLTFLLLSLALFILIFGTLPLIFVFHRISLLIIDDLILLLTLLLVLWPLLFFLFILWWVFVLGIFSSFFYR